MPHPLALIRRRFRAWWQSRLPRTDTLKLTQRNVYILPTRAGFMFCATLMVLLIASINYQLSLGYLLTFLLTGSGAVAMHVTHGTLRGLVLHLRSPSPTFAGSPALLDITLTSAGSARFGIGVRMEDGDPAKLGWVDVPEMSQAHARVSFIPAKRGRHAVEAIHLETRFPLGLFRAWAVWRPAAQLLVYPRPEQPAAPLPQAQAVAGELASRQRTEGGDVEGIRPYRRGDALKLVAWKKAASSLEAGGDLVTRDTSSAMQQHLWLDWQLCAGLAPEDRLSRLAAWVLATESLDISHGLRLPGLQIETDAGQAHRTRCLETLAMYGRR